MDTLALRRHAHRLHRWAGIAIGLQVVLWLTGGLIMALLPIERVRGEHRIAEAPPLAIAPSDLVPFEAAAGVAGAERVAAGRLGTHLGGPVWRIETAGGETVLVDAIRGVRLSPLDGPSAAAVARADYAGPGTVSAVERLATPPAEYGRPGPVWRVTFDDLDATALYVTEDTGEVRARRGRTWRSFDLAWRLHVMDYDDGADFNHPLLQVAAGAGVLLSGSGLVLVGLRLSRMRRRRAV